MQTGTLVCVLTQTYKYSHMNPHRRHHLTRTRSLGEAAIATTLRGCGGSRVGAWQSQAVPSCLERVFRRAALLDRF